MERGERKEGVDKIWIKYFLENPTFKSPNNSNILSKYKIILNTC